MWLGVIVVENGVFGKCFVVVLSGFDVVNYKMCFIEFVKSVIEGNRFIVCVIGL